MRITEFKAHLFNNQIEHRERKANQTHDVYQTEDKERKATIPIEEEEIPYEFCQEVCAKLGIEGINGEPVEELRNEFFRKNGGG